MHKERFKIWGYIVFFGQLQIVYNHLLPHLLFFIIKCVVCIYMFACMKCVWATPQIKFCYKINHYILLLFNYMLIMWDHTCYNLVPATGSYTHTNTSNDTHIPWYEQSQTNITHTLELWPNNYLSWCIPLRV